jgi:hypothetical protein
MSININEYINIILPVDKESILHNINLRIK